MTNRFTEKDKTQFKVWLLKNNLSMRKFAKKCNVSVQYLSSIITGKINVTPSIKELFERNGYKIK